MSKNYEHEYLQKFTDQELLDYWNMVERESKRRTIMKVLGKNLEWYLSESESEMLKKYIKAIFRERGRKTGYYYVNHYVDHYKLSVKKHRFKDSKKGQVKVIHVKDYDPEV